MVTETRSHRATALLTQQSWLFMIGSALFALGSALSISGAAGAHVTNIMFFVGAWFFTSAGLIQWALSGPALETVSETARRGIRAEWMAAAVQSIGTVLFNVSTSAALLATSLTAEERLVWRPDAGGSVAFLISASFVVFALPQGQRIAGPRSTSWWSVLFNLLGCLAFGVSAVGAFITPTGSEADLALANGGTCFGAICFILASLIVLPRLNRSRAKLIPNRQESARSSE